MSKVNLVDLAGSERLSKTNVSAHIMAHVVEVGECGGVMVGLWGLPLLPPHTSSPIVHRDSSEGSHVHKQVPVIPGTSDNCSC